MNIGNKIIELRKKNNLTQEKLAEKLGISRQTLSSWESDITSPNLDQAIILSKELKISLDELVDNKLDIVVKDNIKNSILNDLIGKKCILKFEDVFVDADIYDKKVKVIDVNTDFIKIEYQKGREIVHKLIDIDLVISIRDIEEE